MMADQLRYDAQGAVWKGANTPNLDKLAASGARFMNQYSSTPTCTPARAGILTGQSPWNHGMLGYGAVAPVYPFEMPVALRAVGYTTASIGKDQYAPPPPRPPPSTTCCSSHYISSWKQAAIK